MDTIKKSLPAFEALAKDFNLINKDLKRLPAALAGSLCLFL